jgi:hypothetical protein
MPISAAVSKTILTVNNGRESILRMSSRSRLNSQFCNTWDPFSCVFSGSHIMVGFSAKESSSEAFIVDAVSFVFDEDTSSSMGE